MSLVDYDFSDEDEELPPQAAANTSNAILEISSPAIREESVLASGSSGAQTSASIRMPDVSELLGWMETDGIVAREPSGRSSAVMARDSRKRQELNGSTHLSPHKKLSRGSLPPSRIPLDTAGGQLLPPQLRGRSNVATEDLGRLFLRHHPK